MPETHGPGELLIDVTRLLIQAVARQRPTGIDRVCLAYVRHFANTGRAVIQVRHGIFSYNRILSRADSVVLFERLLQPGPDFRPWLTGFAVRRGWRHQRASPVRGEVYLNVGHMGIGVPGFAQWLQRLEVKPVFMVHDLIPISHPEYCVPGALDRHVARMHTVLRQGAGVITNSQASLQALQGFARQERLPLPPTVTALLGVEELQGQSSSTLPDRPLPGPYFVVLGTLEARKNHLLLFQVWRRWRAEGGPDIARLVVIGKRGWEAESALDMLDRCEALEDVVLEKPDCSDAELQGYLQHAQALLFPSHAEGFGLPLVEALNEGTPVIASDLPVFKEIAQDIPDYLDPLDGLAWLNAVQDYATVHSPRRAAQLARLQGYQAPQWSTHFAQVDAFLDPLR